ncbi:hypothetical protein L211DRAFT_524223 [Terfezia boudieri ATCC MYA-4762]|uniref:Aminoglycoside phosphotransferase domain-containing protein n=1 Tax=Terfezia boudieri ATCC MYA-4762 TaxID=1051890 RepID=A0A3N4LBT9_9PEZI|nr:hypothetical protein L211DRAFT_524223 [Terfezia boudieri ATCC MYA-4762]
MPQRLLEEEDSACGNDLGRDQEEKRQEDAEEADEGDELESFRPLLSHLRLENLPELATSLKTAQLGADASTSSPLTCTVSPQPLTGANNILYRVRFSDSSTWIFKIPCIGYLPEWSEVSGRKLRSEANTMNFIRKHTTIPVPEVYAFDSRLDNVINAPYIAMEFIDGINMFEKWYGTADGDEKRGEEQLEERRVRWLKAVAEILFELGKFRFDKCGMLDFTDDGDGPISIGPLSVSDMEAEKQLQECSIDLVPPKFCEIGPFLDTKTYLLGLLDLRSFTGPTMNLQRILRQLINWIPESIATAQLGPDGNRFVLCHPDFGLQNIMISNDDDCDILSIIDWDGVATSPLCLGNERYPHWLTREWDPLMYQYDPEDPENNKLENSPEDLQRYREIYATYMQRLYKVITCIHNS